MSKKSLFEKLGSRLINIENIFSTTNLTTVAGIMIVIYGLEVMVHSDPIVGIMGDALVTLGVVMSIYKGD